MPSMTEDVDEIVERMANRGCLIIVGAGYVEATKHLQDTPNISVFFSGAKIGDLVIPDALMIRCGLLFCNSFPLPRGRKANQAEIEKRFSELEAGIILKPMNIPGLKPEEIDEPKVSRTCNLDTSNFSLLIQWGPVQSTHCVNVARALETSLQHIAEIEPWFSEAIEEMVSLYVRDPDHGRQRNETIQELERIGKMLNEKGGMNLMRAAHTEFANQCKTRNVRDPSGYVSAPRGLEYRWNGIGSWMS